MTKPFLLTVAARNDLLNIGRFTVKRWGNPQRNKYLKQFDDTFRLLARQPEIGIDASGIKPGYRKFVLGSHVIFYRHGSDSKIVVVRVLHHRMDVDSHL